MQDRLGRPGPDRVSWASFSFLLALHLWALWAHHGLGWPYEHKGVFLFHFDFERNLPTAFSVALLLQASGLSAWAARRAAGGQAKGPRQPGPRQPGPRQPADRAAWWLLFALFAFLAVDEGLALHERLIEPVGAHLPAIDALTFAWIVPYAAAVGLLAIGLWGWLRRLPRTLRRGLQASAVVYLFAALGLEALGGWVLGGDLATRGLGYDLVVTAEEGLEMTGLLLFALALRRHLEGGGRAAHGTSRSRRREAAPGPGQPPP